MYYDPIPELKKKLATELLEVLNAWKPTNLRFWTNLPQPELSRLRHGHLKRFSAERLIRHLADLGYDVELQVVKGKRRRGRILP